MATDGAQLRLFPSIRQTNNVPTTQVADAGIIALFVYLFRSYITISVSIPYTQLSKMSDNAVVKAVFRHLPLLRMPLLLNNLINLILSGILSFDPIFQAQLALISISTLASAFDLIQYWMRRRWARKGRPNVEQDVQVADFTTAVDGGLSVGLLAIWITGIVAFSSWYHLIRAVATFGAFIAWSFHLTSFCVQAYIWMKLGRPAMHRCPNCDYDLSIPTVLTNIPTLSERNSLETQAQAVEPGTPDDSAASEYDEGETDRLILRDSEDKS